MRDQVVPRAVAATGARALIGVVGLSFLLLLAFRAPVVALKAGVMNLLSIGAADGVIALFADGGRAGSPIGIDEALPVAPFIPVMMLAILFGLPSAPAPAPAQSPSAPVTGAH